MGYEAAQIVAKAFKEQEVPDLVKASVLSMVLGTFHEQVEEIDTKSEEENGNSDIEDSASYELFVPVMKGGLLAAYRLAEQNKGRSDDTIKKALQETVWERVVTALSFLLNPLEYSKTGIFAPHTSYVLEILGHLIKYSPPEIHPTLGKVFMTGALQCVKLARSKISTTSQNILESLDCTDALRILRACLTGGLKCDPENKELFRFVERTLQNALKTSRSSDLENEEVLGPGVNSHLYGDSDQLEVSVLEIKFGHVVCEAILDVEVDHQKLNEFLVGVFNLLCKLTNCEDDLLRRRAGAVLATYDLIGNVRESQKQVLEMKTRLITAEQRIQELEKMLDNLKRTTSKNSY